MTRNQTSDVLTKGNHGRVELNRLIGLVGVAGTTNGVDSCRREKACKPYV